VAEVEFLDFRDGVLVEGPDLRRAIAGAIRRHQPNVVVTGYFGATWSPPGVSPGYLNSPDHRALGQCVLDAVADANNEWIFEDLAEPPWRTQYVAVSELLEPAHVVDVAEHVETAVASLSEHRRYLELLSDTPVEEQARQIVDMATLTEDDGRRVGFRLYWG
jgi:LmbE family N-acetylglucosaminyl deacetylase